jgi:hypothetical protein
MKKNYFIVSGLIVAGAVVLMGSSSGRTDDRTGAPSSDGNCGSCHSGGAQGTSVNIGVTEKGMMTPVTSYKAGKTYTVAVGVLGVSTVKGFQSTVLDATNKKTGTTANPSAGSRIISANSRDIVVQNSPSALGAWTYEWTAPASPTGDVTIYASGVAANGLSGDAGDQANIKKMVLTLDASTGTHSNPYIALSAYPNPCKDILTLSKAVDQLTISGINGAVYPAEISGSSLNTRKLPQGIYYLKWSKGNENGMIKFQKI